MYASAGDLATFGRAILTSSLVRPAVTRRWLKPMAFTSDIYAAVGAPWGVRRIKLAGGDNSRRTLTVFNKAGSLGKYSALLTVIPDFNIGFSIMAAGITPAHICLHMADTIGQFLIPTYDYISKRDAITTFGGEYVPNKSASDLNSSLVITGDFERPGLTIESWVSNGTNMVETAMRLQAGAPARQPGARLYYTGLQTVREDGSKRQAWKAVFEDGESPTYDERMFLSDCATWIPLTSVAYAAKPLDEFIFEIDPDGNVVSVENLVLRLPMVRKADENS
jgi:hypothetical protein